MKFSIGRAVVRAVFLAVLLVILVGPSATVERYTCSGCRTQREIATTSFLSWNLARREQSVNPRPDPPKHRHEWALSSIFLKRGLIGILLR